MLPDGLRPTRATKGSAGYDLYATYDGEMRPGEMSMHSFGIAMQFPRNTYGRLAGRSSLSSSGIHVLGGVIDHDYRGEIVGIFFNSGKQSLTYYTGWPICQIIFEQFNPATIEMVEEFDDITERGVKNFGHSFNPPPLKK
jgi:dUTP pyrophosphatase